MLRSVRVKNFQRHAKSMFKLDKVTTFVGASDRGKSAVMRAIVWALTNRPGGDAFVKQGEREVAVGIEFEDAGVVHRLVRSKGPSSNTYKLDGEELKAFGQGVPAQVEQAIKLSPSSVQRQLDPAFWLTLTASQLADEFNKIADLSLLSRMQSGAKSRSAAAEGRVSLLATEVQQTESELEQFAGIDLLLTRGTQLEAQLEAIIAKDQRLSALEMLLVRATQAAKVIQVNEARLADLQNAVEAGEVALQAHRKSKRLSELLEAARGCEAAISQFSGLAEITAEIDAMQASRQALQLGAARMRALTGLLQRGADVMARCEQGEAAVVSAETAFQLMLRKAGRCPLCESPIQ